MTGFQVFNQQGSLQIDSSSPFTFIKDVIPIGAVFGDYYNVPDPWNAGAYRFGGIPGFIRVPGELHWLQLNPGKSAGFAGFNENAGRIIRTSRGQTPQSGYLDVFGESGSLVWSARSAADTPRVKGVLSFGVNTPLDTQDVNFYFDSSPYILLNNIMGEISDDGTGPVGWSGLVFNWTGSTLRFRWVNQLQPLFSQYAASRGGMQVPHALFTRYP